MVPHVFGRALVFQFTVIRVVCWNTLTAALGSSLKGKGTAFRVPHSVQFTDATKANAELALGLAAKQVDEFRDAAQLLSKKKISEPKVNEYFAEVLKWDPKAAKKAKADEEAKPPRMLLQFQQALTYAPRKGASLCRGSKRRAANNSISLNATPMMHGLFISAPHAGRFYVAERSRKGSTKLLWSMMLEYLSMPEIRIEADEVPKHIRRQAYRYLGKVAS